MSKESLRQYIREQRQLQVRDDAIKTALIEKNWDEQIVEDALLEKQESTLIDFSKILTIKDLVTEAGFSYKKDLLRYLLTSAFSGLLPLLLIALFLLPILYDVLVLKFTLLDFLSPTLFPFIIPYILMSICVVTVLSIFGSLLLFDTLIQEGKATLAATLKKSWTLLPGYLWIQFLNFIGALISVIPGLSLFSLSVLLLKLQPVEMSATVRTLSVLGIVLLLLVTIIPLILTSILLSFSTYSYLVDGIRGMHAIKTSIRITKKYIGKIFTRLLFLSLLSGAVYGIINVLLMGFGGFLANIIIAPFTILYMLLLYKNFHTIYKTDTEILEPSIK